MKIILIHGKDTHPQDKWYPWFSKKMNELNIDCIVPKLPEPENPDINCWLSEITKTEPDEDSILIGHSRGGVAILRWLEKMPDSKKVKKVILVAANSGKSNDTTLPETNKGFYSDRGYNFEVIQKHCDCFVVFHSEDDKWVPFAEGEENVKGLNATFYKFTNKGHFGKALGEFPELVDEVVKKD